MITFKIHQIKDIANTDYAFRSFNPNKFNFKDYEERYEMEFVSEDEKTNFEICEVIFYMFNIQYSVLVHIFLCNFLNTQYGCFIFIVSIYHLF